MRNAGIYQQELHCFDYCGFVIYFEISKCDVSRFVLFAQDCFVYLGSFVVPYEF